MLRAVEHLNNSRKRAVNRSISSIVHLRKVEHENSETGSEISNTVEASNQTRTILMLLLFPRVRQTSGHDNA